jgi:SpoVK/Ycf46/Vps4 family AAA+-type ATPase
LTQRALRRLGLDSTLRKRPGAREPVVRLDQVVLPPRVAAAVRMAVAQARHADVLFRRWGLGETIRYGRGTTLLFSGPPGVGKTATAEAIAHALGRPILVASVAELQSCWVGQTEKAIVRVFREAAEAGAVLFWDEADAFFHERDAATRQWEVREVNVLLQELERFEGVCILATNRRTALDAALERRVSMKVEFERPDRAAARRIWSKLLPAKLPLASDVNLDALAAAELTGGQIKNVVLNAARRALLRGRRATVGRADFEEAIRAERDGQWTRREPLGFRG